VTTVVSHATHPAVNDSDVVADATPAPAALPPNLDDLAETIVTAQRAVEQIAGSLLSHAMVAGDALIEAKRQIPRGQWGDYLRHRCDGLGERCAQVYMQLARRRAEITEVIRRGSADLSLAAALQHIKKNPPTVEAQVMESIETDAAIAGNSPEIESDPDEAAILAKRAEHTIVNGAAPIVGSWAAQPDAVVAPPAPAPEPDLTAWLGRDKDDRHAFLKAALGTIGLDDLLAALPSGWGVEIDRRVIDQHAAKRSPLSERLTKALRSALSQSKTDQGRNGALASLNGIHKMLAANGLDLHDVELTAESKRKKA
jgi:hypothetical protein